MAACATLIRRGDLSETSNKHMLRDHREHKRNQMDFFISHSKKAHSFAA